MSQVHNKHVRTILHLVWGEALFLHLGRFMMGVLFTSPRPPKNTNSNNAHVFACLKRFAIVKAKGEGSLAMRDVSDAVVSKKG